MVEVPVQVIDSFTEPQFLSSEGNYTFRQIKSWVDYRPFYIPMAVRNLSLAYPFGLTQDMAFQTFEPIISEKEHSYLFGPGVGSITIWAVVDSLKIELECERSPTCDQPLPAGIRVDEHEIEFPSCDGPIIGLGMIREPNLPVDEIPRTTDIHVEWNYVAWDESVNATFAGKPARALQNCTSFPHQSRYFVLWTGLIGPDPDPGSQPEFIWSDSDLDKNNSDPRPVLGCSAILCAPKMTLSPVAVTREGSDVVLESQASSQGRPFNADIEPLIRMALDPVIPTFNYNPWHPAGKGPLDEGIPTSDPFQLHAWRTAFNTSISSNTSLGWLESEELEKQMKSFFEQMGPSVAHFMLRKDSNATTTRGVASYQAKRLVAVEAAGIALAILTSLSAFLALGILFFFAPTSGIWTRDPGTLLGVATLLQGPTHSTRDRVARSESRPEAITLSLRLYPTPPKFICDRVPRLLPIPRHIRQTPLSSDTPWLIQPRFLAFMVVGVLGLIVSFAALLSIGGTSTNGIATVGLDDNPAISILWTAFPAAVLFAVSLHTTACNGLFRSLAVITRISTPSSSTLLDVSWVDMFGLHVLWRALRGFRFHLSFHEMLTIAANTLTILSTLVFTPHQTNVEAPTEMQPTTWFGIKDAQVMDRTNFDLGIRLGALSVVNRTANNFRYPPATFGSFAFPSFEQLVDSTEDLAGLPDSTVVVNTKALHLSSQCHEVPGSEYQFSIVDQLRGPNDPDTQRNKEGEEDDDDLTRRDGFVDLSSGFRVITQPVACPNGTSTEVNTVTWFRATENQNWGVKDEIYFAVALPSPDDMDAAGHPCNVPDQSDEGMAEGGNPLRFLSSRRWIWGHTSNFSAKGIEMHSYWHCDYTWEAVDARLHLRARDLSVDTSVHTDGDADPAFNMSTSRPWDPPIPLPNLGETRNGYLAFNGTLISVFPDPGDMNSTTVISDEYPDVSSLFRGLFKPYGSLDVGDLSKPERKQAVMDAFDKNYRFMAAQYASIFNRLDRSESSALPPFGVPEGSMKPVQAVLATPVWRLYQNALPTYLILAILIVVLIANVRGLVIFFVRRRRRRGRRSGWIEVTDYPSFVPKGINSVATGVQLWAESNVGRWLPAGADRMDGKELHRLLEAKKFKLGWFRRREDGERLFAIGVLDEEFWDVLEDGGVGKETPRSQ